MEKEKNKYYTPDISEIYIEYECEKVENYDFIDGKEVITYTPYTFDFSYGWLEIPENICENLRTKYLDKSDIESLGWRFQEVIKNTFGIHKYAIENKITTGADFNTWYTLQANFGYKFPIIKVYTEFRGGMIYMESTTCIFNGECKSINELRKILSYIGIKIEQNGKTD